MPRDTRMETSASAGALQAPEIARRRRAAAGGIAGMIVNPAPLTASERFQSGGWLSPKTVRLSSVRFYPLVADCWLLIIPYGSRRLVVAGSRGPASSSGSNLLPP